MPRSVGTLRDPGKNAPTHTARHGHADVHIAFQVIGEGPFDVISGFGEGLKHRPGRAEELARTVARVEPTAA